MKQTLFLLSLLMLTLPTHAQNTFEHVFYASHNVVDMEACDKSIELSNGDYIAMGSNPGCEFCGKTYYIRKYDHQGNLIFEKLFYIGSGGDFPDLIQTKDGNLLFYYAVGFPTVNLTWDFRLYFYKMDLNGDTLFTRNYYYQRPDQNGIDQIHLNELADSSIIYSCSGILLKLSSTLDSIKAVQIARPFFDPFLTSDKTGIIYPKSYTTQHGDSITLIVLNNNLDSLLTLVFPDSNYTSATPYGWAFFRMDVLQPNEYLGIAGKRNGIVDTMRFIKFDSTLHVSWFRDIVVPVNTTYFLYIANDNNSVTFYGEKFDPINSNDSAVYYRLNIQTGDSLQFKVFAAENIYPKTGLRDLKYCTEGYLISGYARADTTGQKSYFAVLDTNGNVSTSVPTVSAPTMNVFNNPTSNQFSVELVGEKTYLFTLTDALGKIIEVKKGNGKINFNIQNYAAGNYFLNVTGDQVKRDVVIIKQ